MGCDVGWLNRADNNDEVIQINQHAQKELKLHPQDVQGKHISQLIAVRYDKQDILPESLINLRHNVKDVEFSEHIHIKSLTTGTKFYTKGQLIGKYSNDRLTQSYLMFRNIENELTQDSILNMALSCTKIFPWYYDMDQDRMIIDASWFAHFDLPVGNCTMSAEEFAIMVPPDDRHHGKYPATSSPPPTPSASAATTVRGSGWKDNPPIWKR